MKIGIVGASGQLGEKTLKALLDRSEVQAGDVVAMSRAPSKLSAWAAQGVETRRADYDDVASLEAACEGVERLLLVPSLSPPAARVIQYDNAISAARKRGVRHLLSYTLVATVLESPFVVTPFLLYAESALRTSGLDWTILRNSLYAEPIMEWVPSIVRMGTIPYPTGNARCAYVCRDDIAHAAAAVLAGEGHAGKTYNLTGPEVLTTAQLCEAVARVTGEKVEASDATDEDYMQACLAEGEPEEFSRLLLTLYHAIRDGHLDLASDDIARLTGKPAKRFEDLLRKHRASA
jgi:NAD(P)H dehydrogenase (quinone)